MIGSGVCRFRCIKSLLALPGRGDSPTHRIRFLGARHGYTFIQVGPLYWPIRARFPGRLPVLVSRGSLGGKLLIL